MIVCIIKYANKCVKCKLFSLCIQHQKNTSIYFVPRSSGAPPELRRSAGAPPERRSSTGAPPERRSYCIYIISDEYVYLLYPPERRSSTGAQTPHLRIPREFYCFLGYIRVSAYVSCRTFQKLSFYTKVAKIKQVVKFL